jgi:phosphopantetheine adenylyltransferase
MDPETPTPKKEFTPRSDAAAASNKSAPIQRTNSAPQLPLQNTTAQPVEPQVKPQVEPSLSMGQIKEEFSKLFAEFRVNTDQQIHRAILNAMATGIQPSQSYSANTNPNSTMPNLSVNGPPLFHPPPVASAVNLGARVKISTPANFTGARNVNVALWLFEMESYMSLCGVYDDQQRVAVASSYLKESAFSWWERLCNQNHIASQSWDHFKVTIRERFQPLAASRTARAQLHNLRQENMSVAEYSNKFYSLIQLINDMSEADQVENFIRGLRNKLGREVDLQDPKLLHTAMSIAQKVETIFDNHRNYWRPANSSTSTTTTSTYTSIPSSTYSYPSSSSVAMDLNNLNLYDSSSSASHSNPVMDNEWSDEREDEYSRYVNEGDGFEPRYDVWEGADAENEQEEKAEQLQAIQQKSRNYSAPFMPREEFTRCMQNRLCLRCKKPGHIARNCPIPRQQPFSSSSSSHPKRNFH